MLTQPFPSISVCQNLWCDSLAKTTLSKKLMSQQLDTVQQSLAAFLVLYASQHSRSSCGGHTRSKGLSHLLSRGSSASYGPGSRKLSYRGRPCHGPLDARGAACSLGSHQIVPAQCSTEEQLLRPPSVRTSCIWKKERITTGCGRF